MHFMTINKRNLPIVPPPFVNPIDWQIPQLAAPQIGSYIQKMVPEVGIEPTRTQGPGDFESPASTNSTTPARYHSIFPAPLLASAFAVASAVKLTPVKPLG